MINMRHTVEFLVSLEKQFLDSGGDFNTILPKFCFEAVTILLHHICGHPSFSLSMVALDAFQSKLQIYSFPSVLP